MQSSKKKVPKRKSKILDSYVKGDGLTLAGGMCYGGGLKLAGGSLQSRGCGVLDPAPKSTAPKMRFSTLN